MNLTRTLGAVLVIICIAAVMPVLEIEAFAGDGPARLGLPSDGLAIGAGLSDADPGYVGYHSRVTPFPIFSYRFKRFFFTGISAGYVGAESDVYTLSVVVLPQMMRLRASDSPELAGLHSRQWSINGGMNLTLEHAWGNLSVNALQDLLDRSNGTELTLQYAYPIPLGGGVLSPGIGVSWEGANLTYYYYGVSSAEAQPDRRVGAHRPRHSCSTQSDERN